MKVRIAEVTEVRVPSEVVASTQQHLRGVGASYLEGMALWAGRQSGPTFEVVECIVPTQQGLRSDHGLMVMIKGEELHRINVHLHDRHLRLIAQIHSHPTHAYHSAMDDEYAIITALGGFSIVVPDFAAAPFDIGSCAVYRLLRKRWWEFGPPLSWRRVKSRSAPKLIRIE